MLMLDKKRAVTSGALSTGRGQDATALALEWEKSPRWRGVKRSYSAQEVVRLRGSVQVEHTLARMGAERLWKLLHEEPYVAALGALSGCQALQQVKAGLQAIYVSGWQVAADANLAGEMYPDQSRFAPSVASVCSIRIVPRSRRTSASVYGRTIPSHRPGVAAGPRLPGAASACISSADIGVFSE